MILTGLLHVKLDVADLQRSLDFYIGVLGFREIARYVIVDSHTIVHVSPTGEPPALELWSEPPRGTLRNDRLHMAWSTMDVHATVEALRRRGVVIEREPFTIGHERLAFVRDPDGYLLELSEQPSGRVTP
jgi:catechol 2,3-dioxygenase-like lactoylglutathione lyase family enzyme